MEKNESIIQTLKQQRVLPLFYHADLEVCVEVTKALYKGGIRAVEFTNRGSEALINFKAIVKARDAGMKDLLLAVGTVRTADHANQFIEAGADFLVSPVFDADVCDAAYINKVLWIPGCMTPTEIHDAENAGCTIVKLFPGNVLGPGFVSAIKELFPRMEFMPTGGVEPELENLQAWFSAGVSAVGIGSKLLDKSLLDSKDYASVEKKTKQLIDLISPIKK